MNKAQTILNSIFKPGLLILVIICTITFLIPRKAYAQSIQSLPSATFHAPQILISPTNYNNEPCYFQTYSQMFWWGMRVYYNDCIIQYVRTIGAGGVASVQSFFSYLGRSLTCGAYWAVCSAVATSSIFYWSWIESENNRCSHRGIFINRTWPSPAMWITGNC